MDIQSPRSQILIHMATFLKRLEGIEHVLRVEVQQEIKQLQNELTHSKEQLVLRLDKVELAEVELSHRLEQTNDKHQEIQEQFLQAANKISDFNSLIGKKGQKPFKIGELQSRSEQNMLNAETSMICSHIDSVEQLSVISCDEHAPCEMPARPGNNEPPQLADMCREMELVRNQLENSKTEQNSLCMRRVERAVAELSRCIDDSDLKQLSRLDALQALLDDEQCRRNMEIAAIHKRVELVERHFQTPKMDMTRATVLETPDTKQLVTRLQDLEACCKDEATEKLAGIRGRIFAAERHFAGVHSLRLPQSAPENAMDCNCANLVPTHSD